MTFQNRNLFHLNKSQRISRKLEKKQKIDEEIKQADTVLQSKNVSIEAIDEHVKLNEKLNEHGLSTQDIDKLLDLPFWGPMDTKIRNLAIELKSYRITKVLH
jgi:hypothetical protein